MIDNKLREVCILQPANISKSQQWNQWNGRQFRDILSKNFGGKWRDNNAYLSNTFHNISFWNENEINCCFKMG